MSRTTAETLLCELRHLRENVIDLWDCTGELPVHDGTSAAAREAADEHLLSALREIRSIGKLVAERADEPGVHHETRQ